MITSIFATYPVTVLIVLVFFGGISDYFGRRENASALFPRFGSRRLEHAHRGAK